MYMMYTMNGIHHDEEVYKYSENIHRCYNMYSVLLSCLNLFSLSGEPDSEIWFSRSLFLFFCLFVLFCVFFFFCFVLLIQLLFLHFMLQNLFLPVTIYVLNVMTTTSWQRLQEYIIALQIQSYLWDESVCIGKRQNTSRPCCNAPNFW